MNSRRLTRKPELAKIRSIALILACLMALGTHAAPKEILYSNPVLAGDYPDPSVIRVGRDYWATAATSDWAPPFPLLHSLDLVNWGHLGNVFQKPPSWSVGSYRAPDLSQHQGKFYLYYVARQQNGPLSIAVATAPRVTGPYTDHGPIVIQEAGSIDPVTATGEDGGRFLIWKEVAHSRNWPTPICAQRLSDDGLHLVGELKELIRNDAPWEGSLVEGPYLVRRNGWFYLFYSGNTCCGPGCNYGIGVARSRGLRGVWEKNPANPILASNNQWKCPGQGSVVSTPQGRDFLLYQAYHAQDSAAAGRQWLLDEINWSANDWPTIHQGARPSSQAPVPHGYSGHNGEHFFLDEFKSGKLTPNWQWPQSNEPEVQFKAGHLELSPGPDATTNLLGAVLAIRTTRGAYEAATLVNLQGMAAGARAGLAAYGDPDNALGIAAGDDKIIVWRREKAKQDVLAEVALRESSKILLRMRSTGGLQFRFSTSLDGRQWRDLQTELNGAFLLPKDHGVRVALTAGGAENAVARFDWFRMDPVRGR